MDNKLFQEVGTRYDIPPEILKALVQVESSGGSDTRVRVEKHIKDMSIGPAQVLTGTAAWLCKAGLVRSVPVSVKLCEAYRSAQTDGLSPVWSAMQDPVVSLELAAAYLRWQMDRYGAITPALAAYNAGSARYRGDGTFTNQDYVDKIFKAISEG